MKDHEIRTLVNKLHEIAIQFHGSQQLREQIAHTVSSAISRQENDIGTNEPMFYVKGDAAIRLLKVKVAMRQSLQNQSQETYYPYISDSNQRRPQERQKAKDFVSLKTGTLHISRRKDRLTGRSSLPGMKTGTC